MSHALVCVWGSELGVGGWLVGSLLSLLMPSSQKPLTGSIHATSVAASRVEQALSEVASSLQSSAPKQGPLHPWMTLAQIWLHAGTTLLPLGTFYPTDPHPPPAAVPEAVDPVRTCLFSPQPLLRRNQSFCSHTPNVTTL